MFFQGRKSVDTLRWSRAGFTLIETAMIIVILGFIIAALIKTIPVMVAQEQERQQEKNYDTVRAALSSYISKDADGNPATPELMARYPCPAPLTVGPANADFGIEQRNAAGNCISTLDGSNGVYRIENAGVPVAYIGAIPTRTLEISSEYMLDPFKNKLTYAVSANMVQDNALNLGNIGSLNIQDDSGITFTSRAQFALISHGQDGSGAFSAEGGQVLPCRTANNDGENCDFTAGAGDAVFREAQVKLGNSADFYDDRLAFSLVDDEDDEWWESVDGIEDIRNKNPGIVCIGNDCDPALASGDDILVADGSIRAVSSVRAAGHLESVLDTVVGRDLIAARDVLAGQDVSASQNVIAGDLLSAGSGLVVGGVTNPAGLGNNAAAIGNIDAGAVGNGSLGVQNDVIAGRDIFGRNITASGNGDFTGTLNVDGMARLYGGLEVDSDNDNDRGSIYNKADSEGLIISAKSISTNRPDIAIDEATGNVGVGTDDPQAKLDVNGDIIARDTLQTDILCDEAGDTCFTHDDIVSLLACTREGLLYDPTHTNADENGCVPSAIFACTTGISVANSSLNIVHGDRDAMVKFYRSSTDWGIRCRNGYQLTGCMVYGSGEDNDLRSYKNNECHSDDDELGRGGQLTAICCGLVLGDEPTDSDPEVEDPGDDTPILDDANCTSDQLGQVRYNITDQVQEYCDGAIWQPAGNIKSDCLRKRSSAYSDDFVAWCNTDYPNLYRDPLKKSFKEFLSPV